MIRLDAKYQLAKSSKLSKMFFMFFMQFFGLGHNKPILNTCAARENRSCTNLEDVGFGWRGPVAVGTWREIRRYTTPTAQAAGVRGDPEWSPRG